MEGKKVVTEAVVLLIPELNVVHQECFGLSRLKALALFFQSNDLCNEQMSFRCRSAPHQVSGGLTQALQKFKLSTCAISDDVGTQSHPTHRTSPGLYLCLNYY